MHYIPPTNSDGYYYVPVVIKNRDSLIGMIQGMDSIYTLISPVLRVVGMDIDEIPEINSCDPESLGLASDRFNDLMPDGRLESDMSANEKKKYLESIIEEAYQKVTCSDNDVARDCVFNVSCECGYGYYSWKTFKDIPEDNFKCLECGKVLIDYTGIDEWDYEFCNIKELTNNEGI